MNPANWHPFAPSGFGGIVTGGAIVFFTYIGFDSVSTAAEESRNPQKDLPFGIIMSLVVCTLLYVGVAVVLLGMMKYTTFVSGAAAEAPVAYAMKYLGAHPLFALRHRHRSADGYDLVSAGVSIWAGAHLVRHVPRRLACPSSSLRCIPKFKTPHFPPGSRVSPWAFPAASWTSQMPPTSANIGTLFAFVLVSLGVIILRRTQPDRKRASRCRLSLGSR